jgi:hypothetical protein
LDALPIAVVVVKGTGMLLLIAGGLFALAWGYRLFRDGAGHGPESLALEVGDLRFSARSVGSVVMATAAFWAWAGVYISPNLEREKDTLRIYSFETSGVKIETPELATLWTAQQLKGWNHQELSAHLSTLLKDEGPSSVRVNGIQGFLSDPSVNLKSGEITFHVGTTPALYVGVERRLPPQTTITYSPAVEGEGDVVLRPVAANIASN